MSRYRPVDPKVDFPEMERRILAFWRDRDIFHKTLELREGAPEWVFYEGPPTANGKPGIHHVESRTFKDVYPRYRTMTGHYVHRRAGWDCHGLPVELEVEREIGTKTKRDIEDFGIAEFNRLCRESVTRYVEAWESLTERIAFWVDLSDAYWTMHTEYVESVWWSLKRLHQQGLLFEDHKSVAYCPRCGTGLSDHEVAQGYTQVTDPSVFVKFPVVEGPPEAKGAAIVGWTTTPWTLPSNLGLAVAPDATYVRVRAGGEDLIVAAALLEPTVRGEAEVVERFPGSLLVGARYSPPFENLDGNTHRVVAADFVAVDEGTGIVHIAPGFGTEDFQLGRQEGWPVYCPVDDAGQFTSEDTVPPYLRGRPVKETDPDIIEDLRSRGLLLRDEPYEHTYPLCWRCDTPLLYVTRTSWYIRTTERKGRLLQVNESVNWYPPHIKHGRYGDWLENNVDWALSRERYWGTPLPLWRCAKAHVTAVGSLKELSERARRDVTGVDPHRPAIDDVVFACPECDAEARRVPEVIDTWYDSGAMPFAQWSYHPELGRGAEEFDKRFPADFIAEGIDQTRGWFYSLMAESALLFDETAYRNVVCLGLLVDIDGIKMSKRLGNVIDPWELLNEVGADAARWFLIAGGSPWSDRRTHLGVFQDVVRQFLLTAWNVYSFYVTYANADHFDPTVAEDVPVATRPALDRWILSQLAQTVAEAREGLEGYDATGAGRRIARFVDDLSNWYVRRARRRFWTGGRGASQATEKVAAYLTLNECLVTVAQLLAPFTPFIAEELWGNLAAGRDGAPESVHLSDYPEPRHEWVDPSLDRAMEVARDLSRLGRNLRTQRNKNVRRPLANAVVHFSGDLSTLESLRPLLVGELNVKTITFSEPSASVIKWRVKPNYRSLGPRLGPNVRDVSKALSEDDGTIARTLAQGQSVPIDINNETVEIGPDDVDLVQEAQEGWGAISEGHLTLAMDFDIPIELHLEGLAREVVRVVQDARKAAGLDVSDRINLAIETSGDVSSAIERHRDYILSEVLAVIYSTHIEGKPDLVVQAEIDGTPVRVAVTRARGQAIATIDTDPGTEG